MVFFSLEFVCLEAEKGKTQKTFSSQISTLVVTPKGEDGVHVPLERGRETGFAAATTPE